MAMAINDCSPPDKALRLLMIFPGGWTLMSMPQFKTSSGSLKVRLAFPPPKSSVKISPKFLLMAAKLSLKSRSISAVKFLMSFSSSDLALAASSTCAFRNSYRSDTSLYSSMAPTLTLPSPRIRFLREASSFCASFRSSMGIAAC